MHKVNDLKIWRKAMKLVKEVYILIAYLPVEEKYGLTSQIKRCSVSIPSNIAEGAGRNSNKEFKYFMNVANGSAYELETQLLLLIELELLEKDKVQPVIDICTEVQTMNYAFQKKLS